MSQRSSWGSNRPARRKGYRELRFYADSHDGRGYRRHSLTIKGTKRDGDARLRDLWTAYADDSPTATMLAAYERWWLPDARERLASGDLAKNTFDLYMSTWTNHVAPRWGECYIDSIKHTDVRDWLLGMTRWTAGISKSLASMVARTAIMMEHAKRDPFGERYRMPKDGSSRAKEIWTLEEIRCAAESARGTVLEVPLILCALGSCRLGEACAVLASEVSISVEHGMRVARVPITRQLLKSGVSDKLKNEQSKRTVCIPEPWSLRLEEIARRNLDEGLSWLNDDGFSEPVSRGTIKAKWSRFEVPGHDRITMQNLRSSWETMMRWELGVAPDMVDSMMGHKAGIRMKHYDRPTPDVYAEICALAHLGRLKK